MAFIINFRAKGALDYANQRFDNREQAEAFENLIDEAGGESWMVD